MEKTAPSRARLFVALDLPEEARAAIVDWQGRVFGGHRRSVRLVRPASLHVTLAFLGHHPEEEIEVIAAAAFGGLGSVPTPMLTPVGLKAVPPRRTRLWALDLEDEGGRAAAVQAAVADPLAAGGWYEPEKRPFWPHVTVARVRARENPPRIEAGPPPGAAAFPASGVVLYRSRLSRAGADYDAVARLTLP